jgi:spoIIIJ-associated protein
MESVEVSAKTVEEAVEQALTRLGKVRDEVEVEVLSEGHRRILGFVRGDSARVKVTVLESAGPASNTPAPAKPAPARMAPARSAIPRASTPPTPKAPEPETAPIKVEGAALVAKDTMEELLENMGIDAIVIAKGGSGGEDSPILLDIAGDDLGILIGRRGETLSSLQFLVNLMVGKRLSSWVRVLIDVESYRARREESLRSLARGAADRVRRTGQTMALEPMPPNERRIVHIALQGDPYVTTESSGYGENRRVNIAPRSRS